MSKKLLIKVILHFFCENINLQIRLNNFLLNKIQHKFLRIFFLINNILMNSYHYLFKFIVIGDTGVGKSCIVLQFIENKIRSSHDVTIGVQFGAKTMPILGRNVKLQIWDTAGQQNFRSITRSYYRSAIGALLVYDITRRQTFDHIRAWLQEVKHNGNPNMQILLVGNKNDLETERAVQYQQGLQIAQQNNLKFIQINTKEHEKVQCAFKTVGETIMQRIDNGLLTVGQGLGIKTGQPDQKQILNRKQQSKQNHTSCC